MGSPMEWRVREVERSECPLECRKIGSAIWPSAKTGRPQPCMVNECAYVQLVSPCERTGRTFEDEKANDG